MITVIVGLMCCLIGIFIGYRLNCEEIRNGIVRCDGKFYTTDELELEVVIKKDKE